MPIEVTMPKLSPTMETGVLSQWLVKVGDTIKEGDALADVETDKATMQMTAYDDGVVALLDHAVGDEVKLGDRVLVLAKKGEDPKQVASSTGASRPRPPRRPSRPKRGRSRAPSRPTRPSVRRLVAPTRTARGPDPRPRSRRPSRPGCMPAAG